MKPLTASEWLKTNYPHATGWHEDYATEYAQYIADFPKWIDVRDRLPEMRQLVLVLFEDKPPKVSFLDENNSWNCVYTYTGPVTHWQPLPELPLTEQNEKQ